MKYVSLDLETTGLDPDNDQILMVSMVVEDTADLKPIEELPHFTCFVEHCRFSGNAYALALNGWILKKLAAGDNSQYPIYDDEFYRPALAFLDQHFPGQRITVAGKNVAGFDIPFLPHQLRSRFRHRVIDPGSVFIDWDAGVIPSLDDLKKKLEVPGEVTHDALDDARDVIKVLRCAYGK